MRRLFLLLAALALLLSACSSAPAEWKTYTSTGGNFSVLAPDTFHETTQSVPSGPVNVDMHLFSLTRGSEVFMMLYADYPADLIQNADPDALLEGGVSGALNSLSATLVSKTDIQLSDALGKEFVGDVPAGKTLANGGQFKARAYLVHARVYALFVAAPKGKDPLADADKFLNSFKLLALPTGASVQPAALAALAGSR